MIRYSSPFRVTSLPEYLPNSTRSPALTSGVFLPSSLTVPLRRRGLALLGLLLALSGMMRPPRRTSFSSIRWIRMRRGRMQGGLQCLSHGADTSLCQVCVTVTIGGVSGPNGLPPVDFTIFFVVQYIS